MRRGKKSQKVKETQHDDRISDLDPNILDNILMHLPTRDAARTSILSTKWRYQWARVPQLILDDKLWQDSVENQISIRTRFTAIAYQILLLHQGPIRKFTLSIPGLEGCPEIDSLIVFLSRRGVEKFTLKFWSGEHYIMPSSFFSCQQLRRLNLHGCLINPPGTFKGFGQLISLKLFKVNIADNILGSLISRCPFLEQLQLEIFGPVDYLEIIAPNLKLLLVGSAIKAIIFMNTPVLAMVSLALCSYEIHVRFGQGGEDIIKQFGSLSNLEKLHLDFYFVKSLAAGGVPRKFATALIHLKHVELWYISLDVLTEVSFVLCLMRSSPNLQDIKISLYHEKQVDASLAYEFLENQLYHEKRVDPSLAYKFLEHQDYSDLNSNKLLEVKLESVSGTENEMEFIKALLENLPKLERLEIKLNADEAVDGGVEKAILKDLLKIRRASPNARIIYTGPLQDQSM